MKTPGRFGVILGIRKALCPFLGRNPERKEDRKNVVYLNSWGQRISPSSQQRPSKPGRPGEGDSALTYMYRGPDPDEMIDDTEDRFQHALPSKP